MGSTGDQKSAETIPRALVEQSVWAALQSPFAQFADRTAISDQSGEVTFGELAAQVERIAAVIHAAVPEKKRAIALLLTQGTPFVAALLAVLRTGHHYVPLNPANPQEANRQILRDAEARLLLTDATLAAIAKSTGETICRIEKIDQSEERAPDRVPHPEICAGDLAGLFYTSGTTGQPKGVMQTQRNFLHGTHSFIRAMGIGPEDRLLLGYHGSTCASVKNIFAGLLTGAALCPWDISQDGAAAMAGWLNEQRITTLYIFRSAFGQCMQAVAPDAQFPQVRALMLSSEPVYDRDVTTWRRRFPAADLFINHLGSTEAGTYRRYGIDRAASVAPGILPLGYPVEDKEVLLCDDAGQKVGADEIGEIVVKSRYIALGYWKQEALSESVFSAPQEPDGARLFRTGDMGRMDADGCLHSLGRKDDQVKIRGRRVEVAAVEAALVALKHIDQAAVVARHFRNGQTQLMAFFVTAEDSLSANGLRRQLASILPAAEVPVSFERLQALPRLPNGKVDRKLLAAHEITPDATPFAGPRDRVEEKLTAVLRQLLQVDELGIDDSIFAHGADSLTAIEIAVAIEQAFGVELPTETLWSGAHSVAALAGRIRQADGRPRASHRPLARPASDGAPFSAPPTGFRPPRRLLVPADITTMALLPAALLIAKLVPEAHWRRAADLFGRLHSALKPWQCRALDQEVARQCDGLADPADGRAVLRGIHAGGFELWLRMLTSPAGWRTPLVLQGQEHVERGLNRGRGVLLWLSPVKFAGIVGHLAVHRAGYPVNLLSREEHGLSSSLFGQRFLNRFTYRGGDPAHAKRIVMIEDGRAAIETLRQLLRDNRVVAITAAALTDRPFRCRFLDSEIELASGPPRLALATGAALLPVFAHRHGKGFHVQVTQALAPEDGAEGTPVESLLQQFVQQLEGFVRQHPAELNHWASLQ